MKYVLIIILILCCTYVGYGISKYFSNRKAFFSDLVLMMDKLRLDISFSKEKIGDIVSNFSALSKPFQKLQSNFLQMLKDNEFNQDVLLREINILKEEEKNSIILFFKSLGRFDVENQTKQIVSFTDEFKRYENESAIQKQKYSSLFIKLGFIIGVLISLLVI